MIRILWNCRGLDHPSIIRSLRDYVKSHRSSFVFLSEVKCSNSVQIEKIVKSLKFQSFEFVPSVGRSGGLLLMWQQNLNIKVIDSLNSLINCLVFSQNSCTP